MKHFAIEQRVFIVKRYFKSCESFVEVCKIFRTTYARENSPSNKHIKKVVDKFGGSGSLKDETSKIYQKTFQRLYAVY